MHFREMNGALPPSFFCSGVCNVRVLRDYGQHGQQYLIIFQSGFSLRASDWRIGFVDAPFLLSLSLSLSLSPLSLFSSQVDFYFLLPPVPRLNELLDWR